MNHDNAERGWRPIHNFAEAGPSLPARHPRSPVAQYSPCQRTHLPFSILIYIYLTNYRLTDWSPNANNKALNLKYEIMKENT